MTARWIWPCVCLGLCGTPVFAQMAIPERVQEGLVASPGDKGLDLPGFQARWHSLFMRADADKNGLISAPEWANGQADRRAVMRSHGIDPTQYGGDGRLFTILDADGDGFVSPTEIDGLAAVRFTAADADHDGYVTQKEGRNAWHTRH